MTSQRISLLLLTTALLWSGSAQAQPVPDNGVGYQALADIVDPKIKQFVNDNKLPGLQVAVSKDGRVVFTKSYGYANVGNNMEMQPHFRNRIGSVSKIVNAVTTFKVAESLNPNLELLDRPIYGPWGLLPSWEPEYGVLIQDQTQGRKRHTPVVGTFIVNGSDLTYTYYDDRTYSIGRTHDLDLFGQGFPYDLPSDQTVRDIRGMAASPNGNVYTWYSDGSLSKGGLSNLESEDYIDASDDNISGVRYPTNQRADFLVGVGFAKSSGKAYAWFEDGTRSYGTPMDLRESVDTYDPAEGKTPYEIRSMAISSSDRVYAFYSDDQVSSGTSRNLDSARTLYGTSIASNVSPQPWWLWYNKITLKHLLSHTAGFRRDSSAMGGAMMFHPNEDPKVAARDLGLRKMHRYALAARDLIFEPGTDTEYSNHGAAVAGWVIEELVNLPFKTTADLLILDPLGLDMKRAWDPLDNSDASPHTPDGDGNPVPCFASCPVDIDFSEQSGYLTSSAHDLVKLMLAMDQNPSHDDILLPSTLTTMETETIDDSLMGWRGNSNRLRHTGDVKGGMAVVGKYNSGAESGITVAIVTNISKDASLSSLRNIIAADAASINIPGNYDLHGNY